MNNLFDTAQLKRQLQRAQPQWTSADFLYQHMAKALQDRLMDIKRSLPVVLEISPVQAVITSALQDAKQIIHHDHMALWHGWGALTHILDPDLPLPFTTQQYDAIIILGNAHWIQDLPGFLIQVKQALKPDGVMLMAMIGGNSLHELREAIIVTEERLCSGYSPRISPFVSLYDMASLMQRAGYALPVVDHDILTVTYTGLRPLVSDLRAMGQTNAVQARRKTILPKNFWPQVEAYYIAQYSLPDGRLPVTVEMLYCLGWSPDASQPQPLKRGSGVVSLTEILGK